MLFMFCFCILF
uniref:Uncharacterized protein n=1 Tax=Rhizophora mucronata TaxID=61149 RepID=A0A2P2Q0U7_RHIMU